MFISEIVGDLVDRKRWLKRRAEYMQAARGCLKALTSDSSYDLGVVAGVRVAGTLPAKYSGKPDHPNVKRAVGEWVAKARTSHAIAMGRRPVLNGVIIVGNDAVAGPLYVEGL